MGAVVMGKVESGSVREGDNLMVMPDRDLVRTFGLEYLGLKIRKFNLVLYSRVLDFFTVGYMALLHIHSVIEECEIIELLQQIDPKTRKPMQKKVLFVNNGGIVLCRILVKVPICIEKFSDFPLLGSFTLRAAGNEAFAVGKVLDFASTSASSSSDLA